MKDIKYQMGFSFGRLGHAPVVGLGGTVGGWGVKNFFLPKFNQSRCVSYLHEWHMQRHNFWAPAPWDLGEEPKGQISLNLNISVGGSKIFFSEIQPELV